MTNLILIENGKENPIAVCDNIFDVARTMIMELEYELAEIQRENPNAYNYEIEIEYIEYGKDYHPLAQRYSAVHTLITYTYKTSDNVVEVHMYDSELYYFTLYQLNKHKEEDYGEYIV